MEASSGTTGKRARQDVGENGVAGYAGVEEPPSKPSKEGRGHCGPRPTIPPDRRPAASSPSSHRRRFYGWVTRRTGWQAQLH
ncbi:hypothetical protein MRX96_006376 [Rhipicephalus microplus]